LRGKHEEIWDRNDDDLGTGGLEPMNKIPCDFEILFLVNLGTPNGENAEWKLDLFDILPVSISHVRSGYERFVPQ
jgi:hypothetical protein